MKQTQQVPTDKLIYRLRMMADVGGVLTRDRIKTIIAAADRMEDLQERVDIMTEHEPVTENDLSFPGEGGDA